MSTAEEKPKLAPSGDEPETKPKLRICCACPETKKLRDNCMVEHGEDKCKEQIEAHLKCLRKAGFDV
eukprot:CAMPEP_0114626214 /NCGR_PEP_ID=MMETSP0168-20121206/11664_1 /TAXON_ID=95228 ORGANISM="Vannella sp., Strain DIVA3 517/6/12" /NCGR_SAMPLE_ID=MMETSP0168 /ASSEMBLY_ACC=CAM_ASM_000044 /LENGTH=66 /DNA_ID=CAMNT_0001837507 /DNA_START=89 /DNA_END=289 /DNA_ORIENTATION=+